MAETVPKSRISTWRLILLPAILTLAVTIFRLEGELHQWSNDWFNPQGGPWSVVSIVWLPFIFGPYFGWKTGFLGQFFGWKSGSHGEPIVPISMIEGRILLALCMVALAIGGAEIFSPQFKTHVWGCVIMGVGMAFLYPTVPAWFKATAAYAFAARGPVAIVMFFAMQDNWGTQYDALPSGYSGPPDFWPQYIQIALLPQLVCWVVYTVFAGLFCVLLVAILLPPKRGVKF